MAADEHRSFPARLVWRAQQADDVDRVHVVHGGERDADAHACRNVETRQGRGGIGPARLHRCPLVRDLLAARRHELVGDVLGDDQRGDRRRLEAGRERIAQGRAADHQDGGGALLISAFDHARAARCPRPGDQCDLPAHVRAGEVVLPPTARGPADDRDLGLDAARARAAADAFGEVDARAVGLLARRQDRHRGQVDDRHREVLEERAAVACRLEPDLAKAVRHVRGRLEISGGSRVAATAGRIGEIVDVRFRSRGVEDGSGDRGLERRRCGRRLRGGRLDAVRCAREDDRCDEKERSQRTHYT